MVVVAVVVAVVPRHPVAMRRAVVTLAAKAVAAIVRDRTPAEARRPHAVMARPARVAATVVAAQTLPVAARPLAHPAARPARAVAAAMAAAPA